MSNSTAYAVRGAVKLNGQVIQGWSAFDVNNNSYSSADTFTCTFLANKLPPAQNADWFSSQKDAYVELFVGTPANPLKWTATELPSWIYGQVDHIDYEPCSGTISVSGRDLTRLLIDAKTTEKWQNKTASQIATILAQRHGLTAQVVATKTQVGKYYEIDHEQMHDARTEWDLLTHLARIEQFDVHVRGQTLFFQPKASSTAAPYPVIWTPPDESTGFPTCSVLDLKLGRALTVSRGIVVTVRSWNDAAQKVFTASYPPNAAKQIKPGSATLPGNATQYFYNIANLTQQAVVQRAYAQYQDLIQHEMTASFSIPGTSALDVPGTINLSGTGTKWDQPYYPDSIKRKLSFASGYTMEVSAKNHSPDSEETTA